MNQNEEILKKLNYEIESIVENLKETLKLFKIEESEETKEMRDLITIKRRIVEITDAILLIFHLLVKLKYLKYEKDNFKGEELIIKDNGALFEELIQNTFK